MFLAKRLEKHNRWPQPDFNQCMYMVDFINQANPTKIEFAEFLKVGEPKARSFLEGLRACGLITHNTRTKTFVPTNLFEIASEFTTEDLCAIMYFLYSQNLEVGHWLIYEVFSNLAAKGINKVSVEEIKTKYLDDLVEDKTKKQIFKPLFGELYTFFGNFSGKANHRSLFSNLEMFHAENNMLCFKPYEPKLEVMYFLFINATKHFFKNNNSFAVSFFTDCDSLPFRGFFLPIHTIKNYLLEFERLGYIRIVKSADLNHVYLNNFL